MKKKYFLLFCCSFFLILNVNQVKAEEPCLESFYQNSLHFSGEGMRYWYEARDGFMSLTKIPYNQLDCKQCHANSCDQCHLIKNKAGKKEFSVNKAKKETTCFQCHEGAKLVAQISKKKGQEDVHTAAGMSCVDCHGEIDVHGDDKARKSMRDPGAVKAGCEKCHIGDKATGPKYDPTIRPHKKHKGGKQLHCSACHVRWSMNCYNCHFSEFMKTKTRKGNFIPTTDWLLLVNYKGKVTAATAMVLVYDKQTYVSYTPYFTHNVMKKGRACEECHGNEGMQLVRRGKKIPLVNYNNGEIEFWKGVVPVADNIIEWQFMDKQKGKWTPLESKEPDIERFSLYAEPLSKKQLKLLKLRIRSKKEKKKKKEN